MILSCILLFLSLFLDTILPSLFKGFIFFFSIASVVISTILIKDNKTKYVALILFGIIYDLINTNAIFLHAFIFTLIGYVSSKIADDTNFIRGLFSYFTSVFLYVLVIFIFTSLYTNYNYFLLFVKLVRSIFLNTFYFALIYLVYIVIKRLSGNTKKKYSYF